MPTQPRSDHAIIAGANRKTAASPTSRAAQRRFANIAPRAEVVQSVQSRRTSSPDLSLSAVKRYNEIDRQGVE